MGIVEYNFAMSNIPTYEEIMDLQDNIRKTLKDMKINQPDFMESIERYNARIMSLEMDESDLIENMINKIIR